MSAPSKSAPNQALITGESMPVEKKPGDAVYAGTINEQGLLEVRVTTQRGNSTLARIVRIIEETQQNQAPTQRFIDAFARYYTPAVVLAAVLVAVMPPLLWHQPVHAWLYKASVILVIACPCALVISTPVTVVSGLTAAAKRGILRWPVSGSGLQAQRDRARQDWHLDRGPAGGRGRYAFAGFFAR